MKHPSLAFPIAPALAAGWLVTPSLHAEIIKRGNIRL